VSGAFQGISRMNMMVGFVQTMRGKLMDKVQKFWQIGELL